MNTVSRRQFLHRSALGALALPFGGSRGSGATADSLPAIDIRERGARPDGSNCASVINRAIEDCSRGGGGTIRVPPGIYSVGSIRLQSNVTLHLEGGAVLKALDGAMDPWEPNPHDQSLMDSAYYHWHASLIWGEKVENIRILGPGTLDGSALTRSSKVKPGTGDKGIALKLCRNVEIRGLNIEYGGHYAILATGCRNVVIDRLNIMTGRDGINLAQCRDVAVTDSFVNALRLENGKQAGGDDAIKLGSDLSLGEVLPSENITVRNCILASGCNTLQFGTETIGAFHKIRFENIRILAAGKAGIGITSNDGSVIEDVAYRNIRMTQTYMPFFLKISDVARVPPGTYRRGAIRNIRFEGIAISDSFSFLRDRENTSVLWGKPGSPVENVEFRNIRLTVHGGHRAFDPAKYPAETDERFPQNLAELPAYGWYLRHIKNVRFDDCQVGFDQTDARPALLIDDAETVALERCTLQQAKGVARIAIRDAARDLRIRDCPGLPELHQTLVSREI